MPWVINNTIHPFDLVIQMPGSRVLRLRLDPGGSVEVGDGDVGAIKTNAYCKHLLRTEVLSISKDKTAAKPKKVEAAVETTPEPKPEPKKRGRKKKSTFDNLDEN
jgi:hypothetical protein